DGTTDGQSEVVSENRLSTSEFASASNSDTVSAPTDEVEKRGETSVASKATGDGLASEANGSSETVSEQDQQLLAQADEAGLPGDSAGSTKVSMRALTPDEDDNIPVAVKSEDVVDSGDELTALAEEPTLVADAEDRIPSRTEVIAARIPAEDLADPPPTSPAIDGDVASLEAVTESPATMEGLSQEEVAEASSNRAVVSEMQLAATQPSVPGNSEPDEEDSSERNESSRESLADSTLDSVVAFAAVQPAFTNLDQSDWFCAMPKAEDGSISAQSAPLANSTATNAQKSESDGRTTSDQKESPPAKDDEDAPLSAFESIAMRRLRILQSQSVRQAEDEMIAARSSRLGEMLSPSLDEAYQLPSLENPDAEANKEPGFFELPSFEQLLESQETEQVSQEDGAEVVGHVVASFAVLALPRFAGQRQVRFQSVQARSVKLRRG
ncbi:MAG: hypothetical protein AAGG44_03685, partial [Planctomycetota bacterium]